MKIILIVSSFLFSSLTLQASTDTTTTYQDPISPVKKLKKNKNSRINNYFTISNNPYKVNTLCKLIQVGNYKAVKTLIEEGEDVNKISNKLTPLMYAARHNRVEIVALLIEKGAKLRTRSSKGLSAMQWAKNVNAQASYDLIRQALKNK